MLEIRRYLNVQIDCKRLCAIVQTYIALLIEMEKNINCTKFLVKNIFIKQCYLIVYETEQSLLILSFSCFFF